MKKPAGNKSELSIHRRAEIALKLAVDNALREHARAGLPVYVWRDGKVIEIPPRELEYRLSISQTR
jgi:hypothetical protein